MVSDRPKFQINNSRNRTFLLETRKKNRNDLLATINDLTSWHSVKAKRTMGKTREETTNLAQKALTDRGFKACMLKTTMMSMSMNLKYLTSCSAQLTPSHQMKRMSGSILDTTRRTTISLKFRMNNSVNSQISLVRGNRSQKFR